jgi:copper chaperone
MQTVLLKVTGMTCGGCVNSLTHALKAISGVIDIQVTLSTGESSLQYDELLTTPEQLIAVVKDAGYGASLSR